MASAPKPAPAFDRGGRRTRDDGRMLEIDATFGRMLGLVDSQKVGSFAPKSPYAERMIAGQCASALGSSLGAYSQYRAAHTRGLGECVCILSHDQLACLRLNSH